MVKVQRTFYKVPSAKGVSDCDIKSPRASCEPLLSQRGGCLLFLKIRA